MILKNQDIGWLATAIKDPPNNTAMKPLIQHLLLVKQLSKAYTSTAVGEQVDLKQHLDQEIYLLTQLQTMSLTN